MTDEERRSQEELENGNGDGTIELDESLLDEQSDLQKLADELGGEHEKSKKKRFFGKFGKENRDSKAVKELEEQLKAKEEKIAHLEEQLKAKDEKLAELDGNLKLMVAENRNQKTRIENEFRSKIRFAVEDFFKDFIPVKDDFDKAMEFVPQTEEADKDPFIQGIKNLLQKFNNVCAKHGLEGFSSIGEKFDPSIHQAMSMVNVDGKEANEIIAEYVKCYKLHDRVIRPAMVIVASGKLAAPAPAPEEKKEETAAEAEEKPAENSAEMNGSTSAEEDSADQK